MSYSSDLDDLMSARRKKSDGTADSNGAAIGRIEVKKVAVPASRVIKLPDGTVIVRDKKDEN